MSICTLMHRRYSISPPNSHEEYDIAIGNGVTITCTVTNSPHTVNEWIAETVSRRHFLVHGEVVGLDVQWSFGHNNPVATLQLCVGNRCLVFQLLHASHVPQSLRYFLRDHFHNFVGVAVQNDAQKLLKDYGLEVSRTVDLATLAKRRLGWVNGSYPGLKLLASVVLGWDIEKPRHVIMSQWDNRWLSLEQVQYACVDVFASNQIGWILRAWEE